MQEKAGGRLLVGPLFFFLFFLYLVFLCPLLYGGDSPLLATAVFSLGLAHPPGYPLYVLLGKGVSLLPFGALSFKANVFSALAGALAAALLLRLSLELGAPWWAGLWASFLAAFSPLVWVEATKAEVYALNALLVLLILYGALRALRDVRWLYVASFLLGLSLGNHHTAALMVLPLGGAFLLGRGSWRVLFFCGLFFGAGMLVEVFLWLRSLRHSQGEALFGFSTVLDWKGFLKTFLRLQYGEGTPGAVASSVGQAAPWLWGPWNVLRHLLWPHLGLSLLFLLPAVVGFFRRPGEGLLWALAAGGFWVVLSALSFGAREPSSRAVFMALPYHLPLVHLVALALALGAGWCSGALGRRGLPWRPLVVALLGAVLALRLPATLKGHSLEGYFFVEDFAEGLLGVLPPKAAVITNSDSSYFPAFYKVLLERRRDDVLVLFTMEGVVATQVAPRWKYEHFYPELYASEEPGLVMLQGRFALRGRLFAYGYLGQPGFIKERFEALPYGYVFRLYRRDALPTGWEEESLAALGKTVWERAVRVRDVDVLTANLMGAYLVPLAHGGFLMHERGRVERARELYRQALCFLYPESLAQYLSYLKLRGRRQELSVLARYLQRLEVSGAQALAQKVKEALEHF